MTNTKELNQMALSATLHCLSGCALGEITGLIIGSIFGLPGAITIILAVSLAFLFGYSLSIIPLVKSGMNVRSALSIVLAADTLSIFVMELVDNGVMIAIPGAMTATIINPLFWLSMIIALTVAFWAAYPLNRYLLTKNKGHALVMAAYGNEVHHH